MFLEVLGYGRKGEVLLDFRAGRVASEAHRHELQPSEGMIGFYLYNVSS